MNNNFSEEMLANLREKVKNEMGEKRYFHTLEVEKMATHLGKIYAPDQIPMLRVAALLHDVTKERTTEEHIAICEEAGLLVLKAERKSPKMFHAKTAALIIPKKYPEFASDEVIRSDLFKATTTGIPSSISWVVKNKERLKLVASTMLTITSTFSLRIYSLVTLSSEVKGDIEYAPGRSTAIRSWPPE